MSTWGETSVEKWFGEEVRGEEDRKEVVEGIK